MGFFKFMSFGEPLPTPVAEHEITIDLTTAYPPRKPVPFRPTKSSIRVPMEIVLNILEAAYYDPVTLEPATALLRSCALVCKDWAGPAQTLLFRHVSLTSQTAYIAFASAVDRRAELATAVVRMRVVLDPNQPYRLAHRSFARAVTMCPNLYELDLSLYDRTAPAAGSLRMERQALSSFDARTLAKLKEGPRITALQFSNWSSNAHAAAQLLSAYPSLKSLVLRGSTEPLPPPTPSPSPYPGALKELRMNFQHAPSLEFVEWLLSSSESKAGQEGKEQIQGSLEVLELEREPPPALLDHIVSTHGSHLTSLSLPACGLHEHALAVSRLTSLREFRIEDPWAAPMVFKRLPYSIEHLAFGVGPETSLQVVLEAIKGREGLRAVTVQVWCGGEKHPLLDQIKIACAVRGVEMRVMTDVRLFRALVRGDPVPVESFPRVKSHHNLQIMRASAQTAASESTFVPLQPMPIPTAPVPISTPHAHAQAKPPTILMTI